MLTRQPGRYGRKPDDRGSWARQSGRGGRPRDRGAPRPYLARPAPVPPTI
ncbi:hypothetical protein AB0K16_02505 [Nonomuraea jabiensis]